MEECYQEAKPLLCVCVHLARISSLPQGRWLHFKMNTKTIPNTGPLHDIIVRRVTMFRNNMLGGLNIFANCTCQHSVVKYYYSLTLWCSYDTTSQLGSDGCFGIALTIR